jgi:hypothetical protein
LSSVGAPINWMRIKRAPTSRRVLSVEELAGALHALSVHGKRCAPGEEEERER